MWMRCLSPNIRSNPMASLPRYCGHSKKFGSPLRKGDSGPTSNPGAPSRRLPQAQTVGVLSCQGPINSGHFHGDCGMTRMRRYPVPCRLASARLFACSRGLARLRPGVHLRPTEYHEVLRCTQFGLHVVPRPHSRDLTHERRFALLRPRQAGRLATSLHLYSFRWPRH